MWRYYLLCSNQTDIDMKKLLFLVLMLVAAVGMKADDQVTARVSGTSLNIALQNATTYCAFQMDIHLPQGISATAVAAVANRLSQTGSDTEIGGTKFIVAHNTLDGNVLRVIAYNLSNAEIKEATGDILAITLSGIVADPTVITVSNILFVNQNDLSEVVLNDATGENGVVLGDVAGNDGQILINDVIAAIQISLVDSVNQKAFAAGKYYNFDAADADGNGSILINDVVQIIAISMSK